MRQAMYTICCPDPTDLCLEAGQQGRQLSSSHHLTAGLQPAGQ